jgi:hypothetical protein
MKKSSLFPSRQQLPKKINFFFKFYLKFFNLKFFFCVRADAVFTASADGKNPSAGKTASTG